MRPDPGSRIPATLVALALVVLLAGCGMGGGRAKPTVIPLAATQGGVPERMGVFVQTPDGLLELREWSMVFVQAPPDTGRLKSDQVRGFLIHQRNVYELDRTRLWVVGTNTEVKMTLEPAPEQQAAWVRLPASLGSGAYVLEVPKDSAMGGTNWHYITIE